VQDCARALGCLADRLDRLERRIEAAPVAPPVPEQAERTVPAVTAQHLDGFDQRLRRLETLPASVGRLQKDTAWLVDLATTRRIEAAATSRAAAADELAPVYKELDSVAEAVSSHHAAATQSLERVRTLDRAVLEMRRHVERSLAENTRANASGQSSVDIRIEALEARLAEIESSTALTR
jgi:hypothetical protein